MTIQNEIHKDYQRINATLDKMNEDYYESSKRVSKAIDEALVVLNQILNKNC